MCVKSRTDKLVCRERSQTLLTPREETGPGRDMLEPAGEAGMPYQYVRVHLVSWSLDTLQCICQTSIKLKENKRNLGEEVYRILLVWFCHLWLPGLVPCSQSPNTTCCMDSVVQYPDTSSPMCLSATVSTCPKPVICLCDLNKIFLPSGVSNFTLSWGWQSWVHDLQPMLMRRW